VKRFPPQASAIAGPVVGMVGGGQLARMSCQAAIALGVDFRVLAGSPDDSAAQIWGPVAFGDYTSVDDMAEFACGCDVLTFDHEHVPGTVLASLVADGVVLRPGPAALRFTQDKVAMRDRLSALGMPCPRYAAVKDLNDVEAFSRGAWPVVLKAVSGGYDGKGVWVCSSAAEAAEVLGHGIELMAEEFVPFERELAVLAAQSPHKQGAVYPVVQTVQRDGICREVIAPAPGLAESRRVQAQQLALRIAAELDVTGLLAVELFETADGLLINELAMRPHNCGHWTIDGARTSQFEQHLRAVLDLPLGSTALSAPVTVMANVLGGDGGDVYRRYLHVMAADPGVKVHMYGKEPRPGRKIGHVTVCGGDVDRVRERARRAASFLRWGREDGE
jgi:5-(carboxyamino)imidazole ribonucleotide synthase